MSSSEVTGFVKCLTDNKVLISKRKNEKTLCFFTFIVWVCCLCTLINTFTLSAEMQADLQYLSSLKQLTVLNLYYLTLTKDEICIVSNVMLFKR